MGDNMGKVKHVCEFCGKPFENYFKTTKYCSKKCYNDYKSAHSKLKNHICPNCGKVFDAHDSSTIYCSKKCADESQRNRVSCVCENCGKKFERAKNAVDKSDRHFCSKECFLDFVSWSKDDEDILKKHYGELSYGEISKLLSRDINPHSIYRKAKELGVVEPANIWTDDEVNILLENYSRVSMKEIMDMLPNRTQSAILGQARKYDLKSKFYLNRRWSDEDTQYLKDNYIDKSYDELSEYLGRTILAIKERMYILDLHKPMEIAGYGNLYNYVRQRLVPWRNKIREENNYTCEITGVRTNIIVHHIRSFNLLLDECIDMLDFPVYDDFSLYTQEQLDKFTESFLELQDYYDLYVCVSENVHKKFHRIYGYGDNTKEQWDEFISNYK